MGTEKERVILSKYIPEVGSHTEAIDGKDYLITNDAMYTFYQRTKGEFSPFFLALRDEKKLLGCKCSKCGLVRVPPFLTHCPDCNFAPTDLVEVQQVGVMNSTPPITYFATSLFQDMAPYGRGRVIFRGAETAMSVNLFTTTGILVPGIIAKGTEVKLIFRDNRIGEMRDVFCVSTAELSPEQIKKNGLQESEVDWESPTEPGLPEPSDEDVPVYRKALGEIKSIIEEMNRNERARKDIAGWKRDILVKTRGGQFTIFINDGDIRIDEFEPPSPDFVMVCEDPWTLLDGLAYRGAITDSVINKKLWISKNMEFNTIFKLDRMARSVARSRKT
ncbi:MAG: hypothetical protein JRJ79_13575 [Deltaproteobacteria bacterium]|nr:hypothetical protein [Deltaproteobacteria bacterium]MBW2340843.1 hypothetical protein [Deltaproteobacteria bacterium]